MPKIKVLYDRLLTAKFLKDNATFNCGHNLADDMHLEIRSDSIDYERILKYKLIDKTTYNVEDLEIDIEAGLEYTGTQAVKDPIAFTVSDGERAIGIQCRDLTEYTNLGPYLGVEGDAGSVLDHYSLREEFREPAATTRWPRVFNIRIKPMEKIAICHTSIDGGHLLTVIYDKYNPEVDITKNDLYLDLYRLDDKEVYIINYIKVKVIAHVN